MILAARGKQPAISESAYVAPTAVIRGDVTIGDGAAILFGAVITAEGGAVRIGADCVIMEQAVLRGTPRAPLTLGDRTLVGPHAHLTGCDIGDDCFLATGSAVFNGARQTLDFPGTVFEVDRSVPKGERTRRYARALQRQQEDEVLDGG
jgi:carbonic anhydrase/acetyltransferase-like protein (isoleucine patch superfamily)